MAHPSGRGARRLNRSIASCPARLQREQLATTAAPDPLSPRVASCGEMGEDLTQRERDAWMEERRERGVVSGAQRLTYMAYAAHRRVRLGSTRVSADRAISDGRVGLYMLCSVSTHRRGRTVEARSHAWAARRVAPRERPDGGGAGAPGRARCGWCVIIYVVLLSRRLGRVAFSDSSPYSTHFRPDFDDLTHGAWADPRPDAGPGARGPDQHLAADRRM